MEEEVRRTSLDPPTRYVRGGKTRHRHGALALLPGAPNYDSQGIEPIIEWALRDVETYQQAGVDGLIVENMWDHPYFVGKEVLPEPMHLSYLGG